MSNCVFSGNSAGDGGGIANYGLEGSATLMVIASTLRSNSASYGSAIHNYRGTVTVSNCTLVGNYGAYAGGAIYNQAESSVTTTVTVVTSTINNNSASYAGGIYNSGIGADAILTVIGTTLSGNSAYFPGGIYNIGASSNTKLTQIGRAHV